jgi:NlpC/P60 family putative phage cell wall peptidase
MATLESPPPCGEVDKIAERDFSGGGPVVAIARTWIGTPYIHQASLKGIGCDCLGLLRGVWRELRGPEPETPPPYAPDWSEATGDESLYDALARHLVEIDPRALAIGDIALFRLHKGAPAKHCGIVALKQRSGGAPDNVATRNDHMTLIHARARRRVSEERLAPFWHTKLAYAFRL